ncbi:MAG: SoxR reducing system RseC family protein [Magnetococcales bacterium]|nr:SoxR reducing system RseC family protein [Magnetococcales bacterium]
MLREQGTVIALDDIHAIVAMQRRSACGTCSAHGSCHTLSGGLNQAEVQVRALNPLQAHIGQSVVLELSEQIFLKAALLVYGLPIVLFLVVGATIRWLLMTQFQLGHDLVEGLSALVALSVLVVTFILMRRYDAHIARSTDHQPTITDVIADRLGESCTLHSNKGIE